MPTNLTVDPDTLVFHDAGLSQTKVVIDETRTRREEADEPLDQGKDEQGEEDSGPPDLRAVDQTDDQRAQGGADVAEGLHEAGEPRGHQRVPGLGDDEIEGEDEGPAADAEQ